MIGVHPCDRRRGIGDRHVVVAGERPHDAERVGEHALGHDRFHREHHAPRLGALVLEHVGQQVTQVCTGAHDLCDGVALVVAQLVHLEQLRETEHRVERRAQLVAHARQELGVGAFGLHGVAGAAALRHECRCIHHVHHIGLRAAIVVAHRRDPDVGPHVGVVAAQEAAAVVVRRLRAVATERRGDHARRVTVARMREIEVMRPDQFVARSAEDATQGRVDVEEPTGRVRQRDAERRVIPGVRVVRRRGMDGHARPRTRGARAADRSGTRSRHPSAGTTGGGRSNERPYGRPMPTRSRALRRESSNGTTMGPPLRRAPSRSRRRAPGVRRTGSRSRAPSRRTGPSRRGRASGGPGARAR